MTRFNLILFTLLFYILPFQLPQDNGGSHVSVPKPMPVKDDKTGQLNALINIVKQMQKSKTNPDTLREMVGIAHAFAKKNNLPIPYQLIWLDAEVAFAEGNNYLANSLMEKVIKVLESTSEKKEMIAARHFQARLLVKSGEFSKAIELFHKNMKAAKDNGMESIYLESLSRMAEIYLTVGNGVESKKYFHALFSESVTVRDTAWMTEALQRLGTIAMKADSNYLLAKKYLTNCIRLAEAAQDTFRVCWAMNHLAWDYYLLNEKDTALKYYNTLVKLATKGKYTVLVTNALGNIGTIYRDKKEYAKAEKYYTKSIHVANSIRNLDNLRWVHQDASEMYSSIGDFQLAYYHYVQYKLYSDSLNNAKFEQGLAEARMKYDVDQQQKELEVLTLKLSQQRWYTYAAAALILLFLLVGLLLIRQFRLSAKRRISEMNHKIAEITQANLRQQMNPHFIFNTLNSIQYYMYQHDKVATNNYLTKFSSLIRKILENSQHTSIPIADELEALQLYLELEKLRFKDKFSYKIILDEEIDTLQYRIPTMLIQPYVENAICHGLVNKEGPGFVDITFGMEEGYISCVIEDNGIGREAAMELKRQKGANHYSLGTRITESRLELVNTLYGTSLKVVCTDLKDDAGQASGTRVEIHIPITT